MTVLERTNVRELRPEALPFRPDLVVADLSFISLGLVLPALRWSAAEGADLVLLVKPQFEAGREAVDRGGVVRDPAAWRDALRRVIVAAAEAGAGPVGVAVSPLLGPAGNAEFFLHARVGAPGEDVPVEEAILEAAALAARREGPGRPVGGAVR